MKNLNFKFCILNFLLCIAFGCATSQRTVEMAQKAQAHYKIGVAYLNEGKVQQAFIEFQKSVELNPNNKDAHYALGTIYHGQGKAKDATIEYQKAISADPNFSDAHNNLGVIYMSLQQWDDAIKEFRESLKNPLYQTPQRAYNNLGFALYSKGEILQAVDAYKEALIIQTDFDFARYNLGRAYISIGKVKEAIAEFQLALKINKNYLEAHYELALAYFKAGDKEKTITHFKKVIELSPDSELASSSKKYIDLLK